MNDEVTSEATKNKHGKVTWFLSASALFESAVRSCHRILVVLLIVSMIQRGSEKVDDFLPYFGWIIVASYLLGGLLGDLLDRSKLFLIIGSTLQFLGLVLLLWQPDFYFEIGVAIIMIGSGFYKSSLLNILGRSYANKLEKADTGFTIYQIAVAIGALVGTVLIGTAPDRGGAEIFFTLVVAAFLCLGTMVFAILAPSGRKRRVNYNSNVLDNSTFPLGSDEAMGESKVDKRLVASKISWKTIIFCLLMVAIFWIGYGFIRSLNGSYVRFKEIADLIYRGDWRSYIGEIAVIAIGVVFAIFRTKKPIKSEVKVGFGFLFLALAYLMILFRNGTYDLVWLSIFSLLIGGSLLLLEPIIYSVLAQRINPKWLGTTYGMMLSIGVGIGYSAKGIQKSYNEEIDANPIMIAMILFSLFAVLGTVLLVYLKVSSRTNLKAN